MNIKKRLLPAAIIVIVTFGCILVSRPTRVLFFMVLGIMSAFELDHVLLKAGRPISRELMCIYVVLQAFLCLAGASAVWMVALFAACAFGSMFWGVLAKEEGAEFAANNAFALMWPFGFYALVMHAAASNIWLQVLCIAILGTWACDSMALIGGRAFGKHKLAPRVSPNKTWEGSVVGGLSAILAGWLISLILAGVAPVDTALCIAVTFIASCFGQVGDLVASLIKRMAGVKDYGSLMPEHGGIMDKMDGMLFSIPATYLCLYIAGLF